MPISSIIVAALADFNTLVQTQIELIKLQMVNRMVSIGGAFIMIVVLASMGLLLLFFAGLWLSYYLSFRFQLPYAGFAITTGLMLLLMFIVWLARKPLIERPLREYLLSKLLSSDQP